MSFETAYIHLHVNLKLKETVMAKTKPFQTSAHRFGSVHWSLRPGALFHLQTSRPSCEEGAG